MPARMSRNASRGWSHWAPGEATEGADKAPRIFFTKRSAGNALTAWLQGVYRREIVRSGGYFDEGDDGDWVVIDKPPVERKRDDMEVVALDLIGLPDA